MPCNHQGCLGPSDPILVVLFSPLPLSVGTWKTPCGGWTIAPFLGSLDVILEVGQGLSHKVMLQRLISGKYATFIFKITGIDLFYSPWVVNIIMSVLFPQIKLKLACENKKW